MISENTNVRNGIILLAYIASILCVFISVTWFRFLLIVYDMGLSQGWTMVISSPQLVDLNIELPLWIAFLVLTLPFSFTVYKYINFS